MTDTTRALAAWVANARLADMPAPVVHEAKRAMLHWVGCALGGCRTPPVETALATYAEFARTPQASILGRHEKTDVLLAALVNSMSADVLGFSDTHLKTVLHPGGVVGPAILALAQRSRVSGADLLLAFLLGLEVTCRIGIGVYRWHYGRGWHITGTVGTFGAAAAASRVLGLDEERTTWALGIAATQAAGLREGFGSMCKSLNPGRAAENGLSAALLAAKGYTSTPSGIEGRRGFAHVLGDQPDLAAITDGLGTRFELLANTYKPFPCGIVIHPLIDGCIRIASNHTLDTTTIRRVALRVHPLVVDLTGRPSPRIRSEAKLSAQHSAAAALRHGRVTELEYAEAIVHDPEIVRLRSVVELLPEAGIREDEAHVAIELVDGRTLECHVDHVVGSEQSPMSDADIATKVRGLADGVLAPAQCEQLIDACWGIANLPDAAQIARLAVPQTA
jgi:2-methylcitrate dehydratase PrpD